MFYKLYDLNLEYAICFEILWPLDGMQGLYLFQEIGIPIPISIPISYSKKLKIK